MLSVFECTFSTLALTEFVYFSIEIKSSGHIIAHQTKVDDIHIKISQNRNAIKWQLGKMPHINTLLLNIPSLLLVHIAFNEIFEMFAGPTWCMCMIEWGQTGFSFVWLATFDVWKIQGGVRECSFRTQSSFVLLNVIQISKNIYHNCFFFLLSNPYCSIAHAVMMKKLCCCPAVSRSFVSVTPHKWLLSLLWDVTQRSELSHTLSHPVWKRSAMHTRAKESEK